MFFGFFQPIKFCIYDPDKLHRCRFFCTRIRTLLVYRKNVILDKNTFLKHKSKYHSNIATNSSICICELTIRFFIFHKWLYIFRCDRLTIITIVVWIRVGRRRRGWRRWRRGRRKCIATYHIWAFIAYSV